MRGYFDGLRGVTSSPRANSRIVRSRAPTLLAGFPPLCPSTPRIADWGSAPNAPSSTGSASRIIREPRRSRSDELHVYGGDNSGLPLRHERRHARDWLLGYLCDADQALHGAPRCARMRLGRKARAVHSSVKPALARVRLEPGCRPPQTDKASESDPGGQSGTGRWRHLPPLRGRNRRSNAKRFCDAA